MFEACDTAAVLREIENEFGETDYGKIKYFTEELHWMGYVYRYWCYTYEKTSKQVYRIMKPSELRQLRRVRQKNSDVKNDVEEK